jgi:dihydroorotase-like cyclic amidohydrolase
LCRNGLIAAIDRQIVTGADRVIDGGGKVLLPGVIDPQVHFREPGKEYKEDLQTGSWVCARGGITSFLEMPNTVPNTTTQERLQDKLDRAASKCVVNYGFSLEPREATRKICAMPTLVAESRFSWAPRRVICLLMTQLHWNLSFEKSLV